MKEIKKWTLLERYLYKEIGIEFKACLYFFCILFFYSMFRITRGSWEASIIHMAEMILTAYGIGYLQVLALNNFDEGEQLRLREVLYILLCTGIYTLVAVLGDWFAGNMWMMVAFFCYMVLVYVCAFLVYKVKRDLDTRVLNEELKAFQEGLERTGQDNGY